MTYEEDSLDHHKGQQKGTHTVQMTNNENKQVQLKGQQLHKLPGLVTGNYHYRMIFSLPLPLPEC